MAVHKVALHVLQMMLCGFQGSPALQDALLGGLIPQPETIPFHCRGETSPSYLQVWPLMTLNPVLLMRNTIAAEDGHDLQDFPKAPRFLHLKVLDIHSEHPHMEES